MEPADLQIQRPTLSEDPHLKLLPPRFTPLVPPAFSAPEPPSFSEDLSQCEPRYAAMPTANTASESFADAIRPSAAAMHAVQPQMQPCLGFQVLCPNTPSEFATEQHLAPIQEQPYTSMDHREAGPPGRTKGNAQGDLPELEQLGLNPALLAQART